MQQRADSPVSQQTADLLATRLTTATPRDYRCQSQPVLASLSRLDATPYTGNFHSVASEIPWQPSSRTTDNGHYTALGTINRMLELGDLVAGLLYLDSGCSYPLHQHTPQELYLVMSGHGQWRFGGAEQFSAQPPGALLYNKSNDLHGIVAGDKPLLALYVLWPDAA